MKKLNKQNPYSYFKIGSLYRAPKGWRAELVKSLENINKLTEFKTIKIETKYLFV